MLKRLKHNRGSMLIASLMFATLLLHAAIEATPLFCKVKARELRQEDAYRLARLNEALQRFERSLGRYPNNAIELVQTKCTPRIYKSLVSKRNFKLVRNERGQITSFTK